MREIILKTLARWHARHPGRMLAVVLVLSLILGTAASFLEQTMRWSDLLPSQDRRTLQYNKIINEFVTATSVVVVVQGEEQNIKRFAEAIIPKIKATVDPKDNQLYVKRIDYKQEIDFIRKHGLMLVKADDLRNMKDVYENPNLIPLLTNINTSLEKEYVGQEKSISTREKEDGAFLFLDGIQNLIETMQKFVVTEFSEGNQWEHLSKQAADKLLFGEPYMLSYDKTTLILNVIPNFTMMDAGKMKSGVDAIQRVVDEALDQFPGVTAGLTGMIPVGHDEMVYGEKSIGYTSVIALVAIFFLLVVSFRMWVAPVLALSNLIVGVVWAMGLAALLVGTLNIMTVMMTVILIGLGIDFSIHMISFFTERRSLGESVPLALEGTFLKSGKGILTGGLTTSIAFLTLTISSSRGMKELGIVTGSGLLAILLASFLFLPALLVFRERRREKRQEQGKQNEAFIKKDISLRFLGKASESLSRHFWVTLATALVITIGLIFSATRISFDQNYMNLEPKGLPSITLQDVVLEKFDLSMDYALILADSVDESRRLAEEARDLVSVAVTEDVALYFPSQEQQRERIPYIEEIRKSIQKAKVRQVFEEHEIDRFSEELKRLEMNIMELQDMAFLGGQDKVDEKCSQIVGSPDDPESKNIIRNFMSIIAENIKQAVPGLLAFQEIFSPYFKESILQMSSLEPIQLEDMSSSILDRYANQNRTQFLVTIFPSGNIWQDSEFLKQFVENLEGIDENVTGMPPVFRALIEIIGKDGRNAALLTLMVVFLLLWLDYRKPSHALIAMIPLTIGVFWMIGLMSLFGIKLTVMSVMGLPMIIGIGVDDGVHIVHRWRSEGRGRIFQVFSSTGKAILLTSVTTMLAFGSLVFSIWRGFASLGVAMFIGVGTLFLSTTFILAGMLGIFENKDKKPKLD